MVSVGERRGGLFALVRRSRDIGAMVLCGRSSASGSRRWNVASLEQFRLVDGKVREARLNHIEQEGIRSTDLIGKSGSLSPPSYLAEFKPDRGWSHCLNPAFTDSYLVSLAVRCY
ncbi:hypothetical protein Bca4012_010810 [Brassica carinata]